MRIDIVTIFPDYFGPVGKDGRVGDSGPLGVSLIGKAGARGDIDFRVHDLRAWATDVHHTVDDTPFGGGPGMVMKADVWGSALDTVLADTGLAAAPAPETQARLVVPTPSGVPFTQEIANRYSQEAHLVFACGRYEGIDSRLVADAKARMPVDEVSIGDYVLAGGEAAVVVIVEAVCRLLPGVLGNEQSHSDDSFGGTGGAMSGLLEGPVYTRPRTWREHEVPDVLLSGNHRAIARWQRDEALRRTAANRPDLIRRLAAAPDGLDKRDRQVLADVGFPVDTENMAH
ncbi:MAG TPA: tRNA (guanosine(37)-N1)-methyltransferase TrmD [Trebonia sp.]|nr:tRNA (guanosine(37)-N1)-methyltransferase TrmD [Trebonia sp.]